VDGRTLEWSTPSPPPAWNFSHLPQVDRADAFWAMKQRHGTAQDRNVGRTYETIHLLGIIRQASFPRVLCGITRILLIWRIWWGAGLGLLGRLWFVSCRRGAPMARSRCPRRTSPPLSAQWAEGEGGMSAAEQTLASSDAVPLSLRALRQRAWSRATVFGCSCYPTS